MNRILLLVALLLTGLAAYGLAADNPQKKQFCIMLKLSERLAGKPASAWTKADEEAVQAHFQRLKKMTDAGEVVLAGRTTNDDDASGFGIVIVEVTEEARAREIMEGDPAVVAGVMKAELYPYHVALLRGK